MDLGILERHEAFLRAIYDRWRDDMPRLVYADWLEEIGEELLARFIRLQIERAQITRHIPDPDDPKRKKLKRQASRLYQELRESGACQWGLSEPPYRGFPGDSRWYVSEADLTDPILRERLVQRSPQVFGLKALSLTSHSGMPSPRWESVEWIDRFMNLSAASKVTSLTINGVFRPDPQMPASVQATYQVPFPGNWVVDGAISCDAVVALSRCPWLSRLDALDLTNNDLGERAAQALIESPYLSKLQTLRLQNGNRLEDCWPMILERFGPDVAQ